MSEKNVGGPAFPCKAVKHKAGEIGNNVPIFEDAEGMTLRDYFAAKAIPLLSEEAPVEGWAAYVAEVAYHLADAMLKAREA